MKLILSFISGLAVGMSTYLSFSGIQSWYKNLAKQKPGQVQYSTIGKTHEGRDVFAIHMGNRTGEVVYLQGLVHAREWATGPILAQIVEGLVGSKLLAKVKVVVVPVANPDGYEYSRNVNKMWRKNRAPSEGSIGVDLNRNFPVRWASATNGFSPATEMYRGRYAGSELEVQAIIHHLQPMHVKAVLDFHAYGKHILCLPAHNVAYTPALKRSKLIGEEMAKLIKTHGIPFSATSIASFSPATGSMVEWAHHQKGALSYGIEVSPNLSEQPNVSIGFFPSPKSLASQAKDLMPAINHLLLSSFYPLKIYAV